MVANRRVSLLGRGSAIIPARHRVERFSIADIRYFNGADHAGLGLQHAG